MDKELKDNLMAGTLSPARYVPTYYESAIQTHHRVARWLTGWRLALVCAVGVLLALAVGALRS